METGLTAFGIEFSELFKSYYVVWKQKKFGSWDTEPKGFKSYYVVWKPICIVLSMAVGASLNRTM